MAVTRIYKYAYLYRHGRSFICGLFKNENISKEFVEVQFSKFLAWKSLKKLGHNSKIYDLDPKSKIYDPEPDLKTPNSIRWRYSNNLEIYSHLWILWA